MSCEESKELVRNLLSLQNYDCNSNSNSNCENEYTGHTGSLSSEQNESKLHLKLKRKRVNKIGSLECIPQRKRKDLETGSLDILPKHNTSSRNNISTDAASMNSTSSRNNISTDAASMNSISNLDDTTDEKCQIIFKIASNYNEGSEEDLKHTLLTYFSSQVIFHVNGQILKGRQHIYEHFKSYLHNFPDSFLLPKSVYMKTADTVMSTFTWNATKVENATNDYDDCEDNYCNRIDADDSSTSADSRNSRKSQKKNMKYKKVLKIVSEVTFLLKLGEGDNYLGADENDFDDDNASVTSNETSNSARSSITFCGDDMPKIIFGSESGASILDDKLRGSIIEFHLDCEFSRTLHLNNNNK